ncbi:hypothetical protein AKJ09_03822 [Labilithrix luteola]|uniref:Outer membrane protein beta-barrel domain-containing protein n=1 Tax=Labilithrix luteola TaxID=1391654 RepID=A0A0K1PUE0_9BACT|nr:hypothetical protein AKJ09_03822 [Labilithrix luteola]
MSAEISPESIDLQKDEKAASADVPGPPPEAPPPLPYKKSLVLDSSVGVLLFFGDFGKAVPAGPYLRTQLGYEVFKWLMIFGEGDLGFTETGEAPRTRAFPIFGFGGGARFTARFTDRFGAYLQGSVGVMKADVAKNALAVLGFKNAEDLGLYAGGRVGLEWYQLDRHFALGVTAGLRDATGFAKTGGSGTPLAFDACASLRYAF